MRLRFSDGPEDERPVVLSFPGASLRFGQLGLMISTDDSRAPWALLCDFRPDSESGERFFNVPTARDRWPGFRYLDVLPDEPGDVG